MRHRFKLRKIAGNPDILKPESLWVWYPLVAECLPVVATSGLLCPFLFGKRRSVTNFRLPKDRLVLRISRHRLDPHKLSPDLSIRDAQLSCERECGWDGPLRRWMQSLPLHSHDILTRWANGQRIVDPIQKSLAVRKLKQLNLGGVWIYKGVVSPDLISTKDPKTDYYVSLKGYHHEA